MTGFNFESMLSIGNVVEPTAVNSMTTDSLGNRFIAGSYRGTVDFDPAHEHVDNADVLTALGDRSNIFVAKYLPTGELDWARSMGSETYGISKSEQGNDVIVDGSGNVFVTGGFASVAQFGATMLTSNGSSDGFLMKLNPSGDVLWATSWGSTGSETGRFLAVAGDGNVLLTAAAPGYLVPLMKFDASTGSLVSQVDLAGNVWGVGARIAVDSAGDIYIANGFGGSLDVDPGPGTHMVSHSVGFTGTQSTYLLKLTGDAEFLWARVFETYPSSPYGRSYPHDLATDSADNVLLSGAYFNQVDFDTSAGSYYQLPLTPSGGYVSKFDSNGNWQWVASADYAHQIVVDGDDAIYAVGATVQKFTSAGQELWKTNAIDVSTYDWDEGERMFFQAARLSDGDGLLIAGHFTGTIDFDAGTPAVFVAAPFQGFVLALAAANGQGTAPVEIELFADSFEVGEWNGVWVEDSQNDWYRSQQRLSTGGYSAEVDGSANNATLMTAVPIDLSGLQSATLTFDWLIENGFDTGEYLALDISTNGGASWIQNVRHLDGNLSPENVWHHETVDLSPYMPSSVKVRFRSTASAADEDANVDNVRIVGVVDGPNMSPIANAAGPYDLNEGSAVNLSGAESSDSDGSISSYAWDFDGDGQYDDGTGVAPSFSTTVSGVYTIGLQVTDERGATGTTIATITVHNVAPTAHAGDDLNGFVGTLLSLSAAGSSDPGNDIGGYNWDLDNDGQFDDASGVNTIFTATVPGVHIVGVQVTDSDGAVSTDWATITVSESLTTKFYVVNDGTSDRTFEYDANGVATVNYAINSGNSSPRGAASTAAGTTVWIADKNRKVFVYNTSGALLGSWTAGTLASNALVEGLATNGTDVWIVDNKSDRVYRYANAAGRLSGSQTAAGSFSLNSGNTNPKGIVTDGTHLWVVNDTSTDKVFKYTLSGALVGSWTIDSGNKTPTGLTIDPSNGSQGIWIVDSGTDRVYHYTDGRLKTSGSLVASLTFTLASGNSNPQGIADPPPPSFLPSTVSNSSQTHSVPTTDAAGKAFATLFLGTGQRLRASQELDHPRVDIRQLDEVMRHPRGVWTTATARARFDASAARRLARVDSRSPEFATDELAHSLERIANELAGVVEPREDGPDIM